MKPIIKVVVVSALSLGLVGGVAAHGKFKRGGSDPSAMAARIVHKVADKLDLNETQTAALEKLSSELQAARSKIKEEVGADREALRNMLTADTFDQAKALDMVNTKTNVVQQSAPVVIGALGGFLDTLSAEQKAEIAEHMGKHHRRHGKGHGEGRRKHRDENDG